MSLTDEIRNRYSLHYNFINYRQTPEYLLTNNLLQCGVTILGTGAVIHFVDYNLPLHSCTRIWLHQIVQTIKDGLPQCTTLLAQISLEDIGRMYKAGMHFSQETNSIKTNLRAITKQNFHDAEDAATDLHVLFLIQELLDLQLLPEGWNITDPVDKGVFMQKSLSKS